MFCPHCGAQISERTRFCGQCGQNVAVDPAGQAGGMPPMQPQPPPQAGGYGFPGGGFTPPVGPPPVYIPPANVEVKTGAWISEGWEIVKADMGGMVLICLVFMLVNGVIPLVLTGPTMIGVFMYISKRMMRQPAELGDIFKGFPWFVPSLVASLLVALFVNIGMILCIIPGLVVAAMYMFTYHFIFDKGMDFWPAMQASHEVVKKNYFGFTMFVVVLGLINFVALLLCIIPMLITLPISYAAVCVAYRDCVGYDPSLRWTQTAQQ
jgi:hypothetical protein